MTHITFLHGANQRLRSMSDWIAQRYAQGKLPLLVYAPDHSQGELLDKLLWTQSALGFIPHCLAGHRLAAETPIVIADSLEQAPHDACLLNLSNETPPGFSRFQELVEIVSIDDADKLPGRDRFRFYRERGYPLDNRDISKGL